MESFTSTQEYEGKATWIYFKGSVDFYNTGPFEEVFRRNFEDNRLILGLDFTDLISIDSSGLTILIEQLQKFEAAGGQMVITGLKNNVRQLFTLTRLEDMFNVFFDQDAAHKYLQNAIEQGE